MLSTDKSGWKEKLKLLRKINWSRGNAALWEGRAMIGGRLSKASSNVVLTSVALKRTLKISLTPEEEKLEQARRRALNV